MKAMQKQTDGVLGFALDSDFLTHQAQCQQCGRYRQDQPATLAHTCIEGAILLKRELALQAERERKFREVPGPKDLLKVSKSLAQRLMRYVP